MILQEDDLSFISKIVENIKNILSANTYNHHKIYILETANNLDHIKDDRNYTDETNKILPKLYGQFYLPSNKQKTFMEQDPLYIEGNKHWAHFGIERGIELGRIQSSMIKIEYL